MGCPTGGLGAACGRLLLRHPPTRLGATCWGRLVTARKEVTDSRCKSECRNQENIEKILVYEVKVKVQPTVLICYRINN